MVRRIDDYLKNVFFIFLLDEHGEEKMIGTGFIVAYPMKGNSSLTYKYFITAKHVIQNAKSFQIAHGLEEKIYTRFNLKSGRSKKFGLDMDGWAYDPDDATIDIAVYPGGNLPNNIDHRAIHTSMAVTKAMLTRRDIAEGDEIFMIGLFSQHYGKLRNQPIVRTGNISSLPRDRVKSDQFGSIEAHLIELRSMGGLSGSPVFVYEGKRGINENLEVTEQNIKWLGIAQGHWDDKTTPHVVNMGIGLVVPANKVLSILKSEPLKSKRSN